MLSPENLNEESTSLLLRKRAAPPLPGDANSDDDSDTPNGSSIQFFNVEILEQKIEQHFRRIENEKVKPTLLPVFEYRASL